MDWEPVAEVCARLDLEQLTDSSVARIRRELPDYRAVPLEEHVSAVREQQINRLAAIAHRRTLDESELAAARVLAQRRARQNVDIDVLIGAYHLGDQTLWRMLVGAASADAVPLLPDVATLMFECLHAVSRVLTAAHAEVTQRMASRRITTSQRLIELLGQQPGHPETSRHAAELGFDPEGAFTGLAVGLPDEGHATPGEVLTELVALGPVAVAHVGGGAVALVQGPTPQELVVTLMTTSSGVPIGIGLTRDGPAGAARSIEDAWMALAGGPTTGQEVVAFEDVWSRVAGLAEAERLAPLLAPARRVAERHPHLAQTILAYADAGMLLTRAAALLNVHANTVTYRLDRWQQLTGWSPRDLDGLARSRLACWLSAGAGPRSS